MLLVIENYQLPKKHWRLKLQIRSIDVWQPLGQCQFHQLLTTFNHSRRPHVHQRPDCPTEWCGHLCEWLQKQNAPPATSNVPPPFLRKVKGMVSSIQKKQLFSCWLEFCLSSKKRPIILITSCFFQEKRSFKCHLFTQKNKIQQLHFRNLSPTSRCAPESVECVEVHVELGYLRGCVSCSRLLWPVVFLITRQQAGKGNHQNGSIFGGRNDSVKIPAIFLGRNPTKKELLPEDACITLLMIFSLELVERTQFFEKNMRIQTWHPPGFS